MARRADHTREALKELAIQAGLDILKNEGSSGFSARKVATKIGYTVGTLYNVFTNYDDLVLHINARTLDEWFGIMQEGVGDEAGIESIRHLAELYSAFSTSHYHQWLMLFQHSTISEHVVPDWYISKLSRFFLLVETLLRPLIPHDPQKVKRAARVLWAGIHGICMLSLSGKLDIVEAESAATLARSFVDNYIAGLRNEQ
jgi:AcrR family transcriptional regulator